MLATKVREKEFIMTDEKITTGSNAVEQNTAEKDKTESNIKKSCCSKQHIPLYLSLIALLLAIYAIFSSNSNSNYDDSAMQTQLSQLDSNVSNINNQLETLSAEVQINRDNLVQNKLKKALEHIRDISEIAEEGSKAAISEVENMLQNLTTMGETLIDSGSTVENIEATNEAVPSEIISEPTLESPAAPETSIPTTILAEPLTETKGTDQAKPHQSEADQSEAGQTEAGQVEDNSHPADATVKTTLQPNPPAMTTPSEPEDETISEINPDTTQAF